MTIMKAQNLPEHFPPSVILLLVTLRNVTITKKLYYKVTKILSSDLKYGIKFNLTTQSQFRFSCQH